MSKGIVVSTPTATRGRLVVIRADDNDHEVRQYDYLDYSNKTGGELKPNDAVLLTITGPGKCDADEKYPATRGVTDVEIFGQWSKEHIRVTAVEADSYGIKVGDITKFNSYPDENGQYTGPPQVNPDDTIEIVLAGDLGGDFVQIIQ